MEVFCFGVTSLGSKSVFLPRNKIASITEDFDRDGNSFAVIEMDNGSIYKAMTGFREILNELK